MSVSFKKLGFLTASAYVCLSMFSAQAHAETDYFDMDPEKLLDLEISSVSKKSERLSKTPAAAYVITQDDIMRAGVTTIPDALRLAPGVQVAQSDGNTWTISIRGLNSTISNKLLVMIDGRTVYNPIYAGTYWEAQDVNFADIDRIEVVRGPGGTLWGANAVNGVINIITKSAYDTQGNVVTAVMGNREKLLSSARHGGMLGDNAAYRVYAKGFDRDNSPSPSGGRAYDSWHSGRSGFRADWKEGYTLQGDVYRTSADQRSNVFFPTTATIDESVEYQGGNILGRLKKDTSNGGLLMLQSYMDYARRNDPALLDDRRWTFDVESQYNLPQSGRHEVIVGANYRYSMDNEDGAPPVGASLSPEENHENLFGTFVQDKITLVPEEWFLTIGTKIEHNDFSGLELEPSARVEWARNDEQTYWASVSRAVRTPSRLEQDVTLPLSTTLTLVSNENFKSEELVAYEAGYRHQFNSRLSADVALFYNDYDQLATLELNSLSTVRYINDMSAESWGAEFSAQWAVSNNWSLAGTYSYIDLTAHSDTLSAFNESSVEDATPHHQASLRSVWNINDDWMLATTAYYVSRVETNDIDPYLRLDMNVGYKINDNVSVNVVGQNLLDKTHREFGSPTSINAAEVERSFFGKITWRF